MRIKKYLAFIIRVILDAFRHTKKIVSILKTVESNGIASLLKIFIINTYYLFPKLRKSVQLDNLKIIESQDKDLIKSENFKAQKVLESLENDGCSSEYLIQKDILSKILDEIFEQNNEDAVLWKKGDTEDSNRRPEESKEKYLKRLADNDTGQGRVMIPIDLRKSKVIRELVLSKTFVNIAQNFLDKKDFSVGVSCLISNPRKSNPTVMEKIHNAQLYHFDNDFSKFCKLYIYLTDVNDFNGPHRFIKKSHRYKKFEHMLMRPISDQEATDNYPIIKKYTGDAGTFFFTDGFGYHKGDELKEQSRIMLNIHFGYEKIKYYKQDLYFRNNELIN